MSEHEGLYVLALDIGTSSVRSRVFNYKGEETGGIGKQLPYQMEQSGDGGSFINPEELAGLIYQVIDAAVHGSEAQGIKISAVAMCTFWHNVLGTDETGQPTTPLINWSDTRPEIILPELKKKIDPKAFTGKTGCPFHAAYLPAKLTWLRQASPNEYKNTRYWMSIGEYVYWQLTGERACSYSMASGSGLLNSAELKWDDALLDTLEITENYFSPLENGNKGRASLRVEFAKRWPSLQGARWYPAYGDGACSNVGCGAAAPNYLAAMIGTSGAMRVVWRGDYHPPGDGLWCYRIDGERVIQGGALSNGGNVIAWLQAQLNLPDVNELDSKLAGQLPDGHGLTVLPFFAGQRSPRWNANSVATFHGLRISSTAQDMTQAAMEAIVYRFRLIHERLVKHCPEDHILLATGGGLNHSRAWTQMLADCLGRPVQRSLVEEASCRGAALMALEAEGALTDIAQQEMQTGEIFEPRDDAKTQYDKGFERHIDFEKTIYNIR